MPWYVVLIIAVVVLSIPALLIARMAAAKQRERRVGSPSEFSLPDESKIDSGG